MDGERKTYKDARGGGISGIWKRYRKAPVVIEATGPIERDEVIETLEGTHRASVGDYIIRGVKGELYPCKPDIFAMTYEPEASVPYNAWTSRSEEIRMLLERGMAPADVARRVGVSVSTVSEINRRMRDLPTSG